jgi:hypothetical protein
MASRYPDAPGYKERGGTSEEAAPSEIEAATLRGLAYRLLSRERLTADEVAQRIGRSVLAIRPRVSELGAQGLVVKTEERRLNTSGKAAVVWTAGDRRQMTIPEIRHCLHALAGQLEVEPNTTHPSRLEVAGILRYLAEQTRRAPRGSRTTGGGPQENAPDQTTQAAE